MAKGSCDTTNGKHLDQLIHANQLMEVAVLEKKKIVFCSWEFALSNSVAVLFAAIVVSVEINRGIIFGATYILDMG